MAEDWYFLRSSRKPKLIPTPPRNLSDGGDQGNNLSISGHKTPRNKPNEREVSPELREFPPAVEGYHSLDETTTEHQDNSDEVDTGRRIRHALDELLQDNSEKDFELTIFDTDPVSEDNSDSSPNRIMAQDNRLLAAVAMQPTKFNGLKPEKGTQWWNAFDRYAAFAGIEGEHKARMAGMLMSGIALHWYESLPAATQTDADQLEEAFREKYINPGPDMLQQQIEILSHHQQASEKVEEFAAETKARLANLGYNANQQMTIIINGLRPDIKSVVMQHLPFANVDALVSKAKHVEQALKCYVQGNITKPKEENDKDREVAAAIEKLTSNVTAMQRAVESQNAKQSNRQRGPDRNSVRRQQPQQDRRCYTCNSPHHLQRDCRQNQPRMTRRCYTCGNPNHLRRNCPEQSQRQDERFNQQNTRWNQYERNYQQFGGHAGGFGQVQNRFNGRPNYQNRRSQWEN